MIRQRISTLVTTASLVLTMSAVSVAVPATTMAALPLVTVGYGTYPSAATSGASPATVSPGKYAAFSIWAYNNDISTISQFFLTDTDLNPDTGGNTAGLVKSVTWSKAGGASHTCKASDPLNCSFGQLKPGQWINALVVYQVPDDGSASMPAFFVWSTVGVGHGYTFPDHDSVAIKDDGDFAGSYIFDSGNVTVGNDAVGPGNTHSTAATVHNSGIPVIVQDGASFTPPSQTTCSLTTSTFDCASLFGEWSLVSVANNHDFVTDTFTITITIDATTIPNGVNKNNIGIYHQYQDESGVWHEELVPLGCSGSYPCFTLTTSKTLWTLVIQTTHNGNFKTF
jgi:hypothetical protein